MTTLTLQLDVAAPPQRCFDLARCMDFHNWSMRATGERALVGPHLQRLIAAHQLNLKNAAESDAWRRYLPSLPL